MRRGGRGGGLLSDETLCDGTCDEKLSVGTGSVGIAAGLKPGVRSIRGMYSPLRDGSELWRLRPLPQLLTSVVPSSKLSSTTSSFLTALPLLFLTRPGSPFPLDRDPLRNLLVPDFDLFP